MEKGLNLTRKQYIITASLLFGMFFGAGNLIFPIHLGQMAGQNWLPAAIGFLVSAICLPLLSILSISMTESSSMYDLALPAGKIFALVFLILTHSSLGLLIASPRTATVTFSMGIQPFIPKAWTQWSLLIFSFLFFGATLLLAYNQNKLTRNVGKILNPILVLLLAFLFFAAFFLKGGDMRSMSLFPASGQGTGSLINGFLQGYNTMDALAGLGFGVTIVTALKLFGQKDNRQRSKSVAIIGALTMGFEALIYIFLIALGASSLAYTKMSADGGTAFTTIMRHYTGMAGASILAALTLIACLTTSIGLITSLSQDWGRRFPRIGYHRFLIFATIVSFSIANFGLDQIILYSSPILSFLYPLAISLIILGIMRPFIGRRPLIYRSTITLTMIPAILDLIHNLPPIFANQSFIAAINAWATHHIFLYSVGLDFLPFMLVGLIGSWVISKFAKQAIPSSEGSSINNN